MKRSPVQRYVLPSVVLVGIAWAAFVISRYSAPPFIAWSVVFGLLLLTAPLLGPYVKRCPGRPTRLGLVMLFGGASLLACIYSAAIVMQFFPRLLQRFDTVILLMGMLGVGTTSCGFLVFGIANLRSRILPRWNALPLLLAALLIATTLPWGILMIVRYGQAMEWLPPQISLVPAYAFLAGWLMLAHTVWSDDRLAGTDGGNA